MAQEESVLRIGRNVFTNMWPVFHFLPDFLGTEAAMVSRVPTGINRAMAEGSIHIAAISSFAYAEHADQYDLLPGLSVSCYGAVNSILLYHRKPLHELRSARVALPTTSATSVNLLKIILQKFYDCRPEYFYAAPDLDEMIKEADAALLIGDDAIRASWREPPGLFVTDLGWLWLKHTGEWMTYAVWAVRRDTAAERPEQVRAVYEAFLASKRKGYRNMDRIVGAAVREIGGTPDFWSMYFSRLSHDFDEPQQSGLSLFFRYARELGLLDRQISLRFWETPTAV